MVTRLDAIRERANDEDARADIPALLAVVEAADRLAGAYRVMVNDYGECRFCYQPSIDHEPDCAAAALDAALAPLLEPEP